jgi:uncharacterized protein YjeT (DUF2065 family)
MSIILAKIFGIYFVSVGIAIFLNPDRFKDIYRKMADNEHVILLGGIIALLLGAFVVSVHNIWVMGWPVILTVIGWMSLIKGVGILIYSHYLRFFSFMFDQPKLVYRLLGVFWSVLGLILLYYGYSESNVFP